LSLMLLDRSPQRMDDPCLTVVNSLHQWLTTGLCWTPELIAEMMAHTDLSDEDEIWSRLIIMAPSLSKRDYQNQSFYSAWRQYVAACPSEMNVNVRHSDGSLQPVVMPVASYYTSRQITISIYSREFFARGGTTRFTRMLQDHFGSTPTSLQFRYENSAQSMVQNLAEGCLTAQQRLDTDPTLIRVLTRVPGNVENFEFDIPVVS